MGKPEWRYRHCHADRLDGKESIGEFIFGFSFLFMGLSLLKTNAPDLSRNPEMLSFVQNYTDMGFGSVILFVVIGTVLTMIVQE